jgi:hypothetical protein
MRRHSEAHRFHVGHNGGKPEGLRGVLQQAGTRLRGQEARPLAEPSRGVHEAGLSGERHVGFLRRIGETPGHSRVLTQVKRQPAVAGTEENQLPAVGRNPDRSDPEQFAWIAASYPMEPAHGMGAHNT